MDNTIRHVGQLTNFSEVFCFSKTNFQPGHDTPVLGPPPPLGTSGHGPLGCDPFGNPKPVPCPVYSDLSSLPTYIIWSLVLEALVPALTSSPGPPPTCHDTLDPGPLLLVILILH